MSEVVPFPHFLVDDFFPRHLLQKAVDAAAVTGDGQVHPAGYRYKNFLDRETILFLYKYIRHEVFAAFQNLYTFSSVYKLPQIYRSPGPWPGLAPHRDDQKGRDLAMIIYLSPSWTPDKGGELQLLSREGSKFTVEKTVEPIFNRAVFFPLSENSWHAVSPVLKKWERITLIQDWQLQVTSPVPPPAATRESDARSGVFSLHSF